ncbi:MAG: monovalent cation/H+ antiporter complex subunit F [candidate division KSB1 bacterium]|nr:monovalent cation/H+ antiporter complex subunit F [candidate division KSB1 bacterium]
MKMIEYAIYAAFFILMLSLFLAFARLVRGPSLPDRVVAFDLITAIILGLIAGYVLLTRATVFLDAAVVVALVSFLGTVAIARYLEKKVTR